MKKIFEYGGVTTLCLFLTVLVIFGVFNVTNNLGATQSEDETVGETNNAKATADQNDTTKDEPSNVVSTTDSNNKINEYTIIVYKYHYLGDDTDDVDEEVAPSFMIGMTEDEFESYFSDWTVESFSQKEVDMEKDVDGTSTQHYILGEQDGMVAVFYSEPVNGTKLKEITDTPTSSLSEDDQARLEIGIPVDGDSDLIKIMQDYDT